MRSTCMKGWMGWLILLCASVALFGCSGSGGGTSGGGSGTVTGFIQDINGRSVIGATVQIGGITTTSNSGGAYVLNNVPAGDRLIKASVTQDGILYFGENTVQVFDETESRSTTVTVVRNSQRATLQGTVYDRDGFVVEGAKVFAASGELTSTYDITDRNGHYSITTLYGGSPYAVVASALGYNSDRDTITVSPGTSQSADFTLANVTDPVMTAVTDLSWTEFTTPAPAFRGGEAVDYNVLKNMIKPERTKLTSSDHQAHYTSGGNYVEVDLYWTPTVSTTNLLGYGIYRGQGDTSSYTDVDFWRDPLAVAYADLDPQFTENQTWSYAITSLNTSYPDGANSESPKSNRVVAHTLNDLELNSPLQGPLTFRWFLVTGADSYSVYLYDTFPAVNVTPVWSGSSVTNAKVYDGGALQSGRRYYYFVSANGFGGNSYSLSYVDSFIAP